MTVKLSISLPDELAEKVQAAVRTGLVPSVSAYVATAIEELPPSALEDAAREDPDDVPTLSQLLDEMDVKYGPVPPEVQAWADEQLSGMRAGGAEPTP